MYTCLFVDDEIEIREGMKGKIDWNSQMFNEPLLAANGAEAIEMLESIEPDLLITDINMPYIDGLQLANWVKKQYPLTKIIILSGIDEFEYAKEALRIHVDAYMLKPVTADELISTIQQLLAELEAERERHSNMKQLEEHYHLSYPIVKEKFLTSLITRVQNKEDVFKKAEKYGVSLQGSLYIISCIEVIHSELIKQTKSSSLAESTDLDLKLFALNNVTTEVWEKYGLGHVFVFSDHLLLLSIFSQDDAQAAVEMTQKAMAEVLKSINRFLNLQVIIGIGSPVDDVNKLKYSYEGALLAIDYRSLLGSNNVFYIEDMELRAPSNFIFDDFKAQQLTRTLKLGTKEELTALLTDIFNEVLEAGVSLANKRYYMHEMLVTIIKLMKTYTSMEHDEMGWISYFNRLQSIEETKAWFALICEQIREQIEEGRETKYKQIIEEAIQYIKENYHDSELSITTVCDHLHISTSYFSGLFKKECKMTFGAYLKQVRMEKAMELLRTTELKSFEIASMVGYADPNYFSLSFKKFVGLSAKDYRNTIKE